MQVPSQRLVCQRACFGIDQSIGSARCVVRQCCVLVAVGVSCWLAGTFRASADDLPDQSPRTPRVIEVPADFSTIQQAVDAAADGDTVRIAPGVYHEQVRIGGKSVKITSWFETTNERRYIRQTVIDGSIDPDPTPEDDIDAIREYGFLVEADAGPETTILGLTIRDCDDGISCEAKIDILFNHFVNNVDAIDYEGGGGLCQYNTFAANDDDAVDLDGSCEVTVSNNKIRDNDDDGIEIRFHEYRGVPLRIVIRGNTITGNGEDGIQIIGYPGVSDRSVLIERNVIARNAMAGIGFMADANTKENYEAASLEELVVIANNTVCENQYGVTGGDNAHVLNNIFAAHQRAALKNVDGKSIILHNLEWQNGTRPVACNLVEGSVTVADPQWDELYGPTSTSRCIDAGKVRFDLDGMTEIVVPEMFLGRAPDLGAFEVR